MALLKSTTLGNFARLPTSGFNVRWWVKRLFSGVTSPRVAFPMESLANRKYRLLRKSGAIWATRFCDSARGFGRGLDHGCMSGSAILLFVNSCPILGSGSESTTILSLY